jgi:hypothetical protein
MLLSAASPCYLGCLLVGVMSGTVDWSGARLLPRNILVRRGTGLALFYLLDHCGYSFCEFDQYETERSRNCRPCSRIEESHQRTRRYAPPCLVVRA